MKAKREAWLDGLKGFAILLVILGHVLSGYLDANTFPDAYYSLYGLRSWIYSFHMPLFFLLSGFTFTLAYYQGGTLQRRRYFRQVWNLLWIYVLFALLLWGVKQAVPELVNETYTIEDLKGMFLTPLGNFWYLYVLLVLYLYCFYRFPRLSGLRLFQVCGKYCLELYLLHTFFTAGLRTLLPMLGITTPWLSVWLNFLFSAGVSLILAALAGKTWVMDIVFRPARFFSRIKAKK